MQKLTTQRVAVAVIFIMLFAIATRIPADTDTWWHLRSAEHTLSEGMIYTDPFSHTYLGETWINHSWGAQIIMLGAYNLLGDAGLALLQSILAVGGMALLFRASEGNVYLRGFVIILGATTASVFWSARPQMFSFLISCYFIYELYRYKANPTRAIFRLIPAMFIWANLHAGWSIGFIVMGAVLVGESLNRFNKNSNLEWRDIIQLGAVMIGCLLVTLISPYGLDNLLVPINTVSIGSLRELIQEWNSPNFQGRETWAFIVSIAVLFATLSGSRRPFDFSHWFLISGTMFMALLYGRNIALFAVVSTPLIAYYANSILEHNNWVLRPRTRVSRMSGRINALLIVIVLFGVSIYLVGSVLLPEPIREAQTEFLPVEAVEFLNEQNLEGNLFNSYNWGGYLMYFAQQHPVFIDGRTDLYGNFLFTQRNIAFALTDWQAELDAFDIEIVFVETRSSLDIAMQQSTQWESIYRDELAVIYTRN